MQIVFWLSTRLRSKDDLEENYIFEMLEQIGVVATFQFPQLIVFECQSIISFPLSKTS